MEFISSHMRPSALELGLAKPVCTWPENSRSLDQDGATSVVAGQRKLRRYAQ